MTKGSIPTPLRGHNFIHCNLHISANIGIRILVDCKRGTRVLHKQIAQPNINLTHIVADGLEYIIRNQMTASRWSRNTYFLLKPHGKNCGTRCCVATTTTGTECCRRSEKSSDGYSRDAETNRRFPDRTKSRQGNRNASKLHEYD